MAKKKQLNIAYYFIITYLILLAFYAIEYYFIGFSYYKDNNSPSSLIFLADFSIYFFVLIGASHLYLSRNGKSVWQRILRINKPISDTIYGALFGIFVAAIWISTDRIFGLLFGDYSIEHPFFEYFETASRWPHIVPVIIVLGILIPVSEAAFFRAFAFKELTNQYGYAKGAVFSSTLVAVINYPDMIQSFCVGIVLCLVYKKRGVIYPSILAHSIANILIISILAVT